MASILREVGLERLWAEIEGRRVLFVDGRPGEEEPDAPGDSPVVGYGGENTVAIPGIDVELIARVLHPTLSSHRFDAMCSHYQVPIRSGDETRALVELLAALIIEATRTDPEVVSLLARLLPPPTGGVFERSLRAPIAPAPASPGATDGEDKPEVVWSSLDEAFAEDGPIAAVSPSYEARDGQRVMAERVEAIMAGGGALSVEAGPGTGKTFAYLVPAILHLERTPEDRIVVCTKTKQLQEQLYDRDIPLLLSCARKPIRVALLKGRENYLCLRRWETLLHGGISGRLDAEDPVLVALLVRWLAETNTGDIEENAAYLSTPGASEMWQRICDSPFHCTAAYCSRSNECFSVLARRRARAADLTVVNHSLLLSDRAAGGVVLGKYSRLIVDEAHAFEEAARNSFTVSLSRRSVERLAEEIRPVRRWRSGWLSRLPLPPADPQVRELAEHVASLRAQVAQLFSVVSGRLADEQRGTLPEWGREAAEFEGLAFRAGEVEDGLRALAGRLEPDEPEAARQAEAMALGISELSSTASRLGRLPEDNRVHWFSRDRGELALHSTPLDVAEILGQVLHPCLESLVLTSATLSLDGSFEYVDRALGINGFDHAEHAIVESPFAYRERMRVCVCTGLPDVVDLDAYTDGLASFLVDLDRRLDRKGLVLFTSHELLRNVRERIHHELPTLAQGLDGPRSKIVRRFRQQAEGGLLLGTASFWEGVDLPGADVEYLVVTRLPFPVPTDPVQLALSERASQQGLDPFRALSMPQAILRLRQGVGRLIRTRNDRGVVFITDRRMVTRTYGRAFSASLPVEVEAFEDGQRMIDNVARWLADVSP